MTGRFYNLIRNPRNTIRFISCKPHYYSLVSRYILLITIFTASMVAARIALAQSSGPGSNKIAAQTSKPDARAIPEAWPPNVSINRVSDIGRHKAVVFSPDFAEPGNREVYERLGFLYIEDASWRNVLNRIDARNYWHPENRIETIILETHGTNGNGLKLQTGPFPRAKRSYISIAALQEKLEGFGVRLCVIGACNAGRLFRPEIYKTLNPQPNDRLFLPATLGIINASRDYDPSKSKVLVVRRAESEIETTSDGDTSELSPVTRVMLGLEQTDEPARAAAPLHFAVSNLLIQMLIHDPRLKLTASGYANEKSRNDLSEDESDALFQLFLTYIDSVAERESLNASAGRLPASTIATTRTAVAPPAHNPHPAPNRVTRTKKRPVRRVID